MIARQKERKPQPHAGKLIREAMGHADLGNWEEREGNRNVAPGLSPAGRKPPGRGDARIGKVLDELERAAGDASRGYSCG